MATIRARIAPAKEGAPATDAAPATADALAAWYLDNPDGTLIAGATDVGLWVTKQFRDLAKVAFLTACTDLQGIAVTDDAIRFGAGVTMTACWRRWPMTTPPTREMIRRYGSVQVRNAATIGGNIANGSPSVTTRRR